MAVTGSSATQIVVYPARIVPLKSGSLVADGTEQTLLEHVGAGRIAGYVDLHGMQEGDVVAIRQYMKLTSEGAYRKYAEEQYSGVHAIPIIYITPKESDFGVKITLRQTAGPMRAYEYNFLKEY